MLKSIFNAMINFFNLVGSLIDFVIGIVKDLIYVIGLMGKMISRIPNYIGWLPSSAIALVTLTFTIVVIYKILGRE